MRIDRITPVCLDLDLENCVEKGSIVVNCDQAESGQVDVFPGGQLHLLRLVDPGMLSAGLVVDVSTLEELVAKQSLEVLEVTGQSWEGVEMTLWRVRAGVFDSIN
jgi:hypothetical protein